MFSALQARGIQEARAQRRAYRFYINETRRANRMIEAAIKRKYQKIQVTMYPEDDLQFDMVYRIADEIAELGYHTEVIPEQDGRTKLRIAWRRR